LLILVGAVMVGIGVKALLDGRRFNATAVEARGIVVEVANVREYDSDLERDVTRPYPVVEFVTAREQVVRYQPPVDSNPPDYRLGGPLTVLYDPADPQHAVLDTWDDVWKMGVVFVSAGLLLMVFNAAMYLLVRSGRVTLWLTGTRQ
jgi:Protein of unknown function (DUF3592)